MRIQLPHRELRLTEEQKQMPAEKRIELVNEILAERLQNKHGEMVTLEEYLQEGFNSQNAIIIMECFSYFIIKEYNQQEDIISQDGMKKMQRGNKNSINFSNLSGEQNIALGLEYQ